MAILTFEEFQKLKKSGETLPPVDMPVVDSPVRLQDYYLFHPDAYKTGYISGDYNIEVFGIIETLEIINGVIKTDIPEIKNELIKKGFQFMYVKDKE